MLDVSEKYREMAESDAREVSVKVEIGNYAVLTNDDIIELNIYRSMGERGFSIGGVVAAQIRLLALMQLPYTGEVTVDVFVGFGFDEENASEYVQLGRFYGYATNPSFDTAQVEIIGYDKLGSGSLNSRCNFAELTFPCTAQEMLEYVCTRKNLETEFQCLDYTVSEMPVRDEAKDESDYERYYTYKDILSFIAAAHSAIAAMNNENKLVFLSVGEETETVDSADCVDFAFKSAEEFTVKGILLHVQDVLSTGSTNIFINDNSKIAYDGETTDGIVEAFCPFGSIEMAEELWQQLGGFSYYSCEFTRRGKGWTELGDIIYAVDSLSGKTLLKHNGKMIAQTVEWKFSAAEGFMEHIISKAESPEESTGRLGNVNSINNGSGGDVTEKIKFVKDNVEYGAVGIHEVDGKMGIALSMSKDAEWIGLLDSDGNKILEYVPKALKSSGHPPHKVRSGLWFFPTSPDGTSGFYFEVPNTEKPVGIFSPSEADESDEKYALVNATYFCRSDDDVAKLKAAGFPNVINISTINNAEWVMNDVSYSASYFSQTTSGLLGGGFFALYLDLSRMPYDAFFPICETQFGLQFGSYGTPVLAACFPECRGIFNEDGSVAQVQIIRRVLATAFSNEGPINGKYRVYATGGIDRPAIAPITITPDDPQYALIKDIIVEAATPDYEDSILVYKNIVLMNGAKILNEDGTAI